MDSYLEKIKHYEASVSFLPSGSGDGYGYGGGAVVTIGGISLVLGEHGIAAELAEELAARWNAHKGELVNPQPF